MQKAYPKQMVIGFTGTQYGMSHEQYNVLLSLIKGLRPTEVHHGMCIGADHQFHEMIRDWDFTCVINGHPPIKKNKYSPDKVNFKYPEKDYLDRNKDIVNASSVLFATPNTEKMVQRSGTWSTVRYAQKLGRRIFVILPSGKVEVSHHEDV